MDEERGFVQALTALAIKRSTAYGNFRVTGEQFVSVGVSSGAQGLSYVINGSMYTHDEQVAGDLLIASVRGYDAPKKA